MNKKDQAGTNKMKKSKMIEMVNNTKAQIRSMKEEIGDLEEVEDVTKYGEFVSSYFAWLTLEKQKQNAEKMESMTKR